MSAPVSWQIFFGFVMFALVFVPLERRFRHRNFGLFRPGWVTDVAYYVAGCFTGRFSDAASVSIMLFVRHVAGWDADRTVAGQSGWIQFLEILILSDFLAYWFHRALHRNTFLWRFHRVHHSSEHMDWLANVRLHPIDKLMGDGFQFVPILCLGFANEPLVAYTIFLGFQGFLNQSNVRIDYGPLRWLIANPQFHHWHHSDDPRYYDTNFAPHFVVCDLLFGTAYIQPRGSMPKTYGVPDVVPEDLWGLMLYPFGRINPVPADRMRFAAERRKFEPISQPRNAAPGRSAGRDAAAQS